MFIRSFIVIVLSINTLACSSTQVSNKWLTKGCNLYPSITNRELPPNDQYLQTKSLQDIYLKANEYANEAAGKVLVVFDIDDTLLTNSAQTKLASSAWVNWQEYLTFNDVNDECRVAKTGQDLYALISIFYAMLDLKETDNNANGYLAQLKKNNIHTFALTSRSPIDLEPTLRELQANELVFNPPPCNRGLCKKTGILSHLEIEAFAIQVFGCEALNANAIFSGFSKTKLDCGEVKLHGNNVEAGHVFTSGREAVISNGVLFSEGQNKGIMLELLLQSFSNTQKVPVRFDHVIFVDDSERNIRNLSNVKSLKLENLILNDTILTLYHYDRNFIRDQYLNDPVALKKTKLQFDSIICQQAEVRKSVRAINLNCMP